MTKIDSSAEQLLLQMQCDKLYGELTIKFENGRVVLLKQTTTIKPASDRDTRSEGE